MSLESARQFVVWIAESGNEHALALQALTTTEERLGYARNLGYDFTIAEHDQAYAELVSAVAEQAPEELTDDQLNAVVGGVTAALPNEMPIRTVYAVNPLQP